MQAPDAGARVEQAVSTDASDAAAPEASATAVTVVEGGNEAVQPPAAPVETATPEPTATAAATSVPIVAPPRPTDTPPPSTAPPPPAAPSSNAALNALEQQLYVAHNAERSNAGIRPLQIDGTLVEVARERARDMATSNYFSHTSASGVTAFTLLSQTGYAYTIAGENIARNNYPESQAPGVAMTGFLNSSGHRANLMEGRFGVVGIGSAVAADGMKYFVVVFAGRS